MAAKRGKNQARRSGRSGGTPGWVWLLAGLLLGGLAFGFLHFRERWATPAGNLPRPDPQARAPAPSADNAVADEPVERPKTNYAFYELLPEKEVIIPDAELDAQARAEGERARIAAAAVAAAAEAADAPGEPTPGSAPGATLPATAVDTTAPAVVPAPTNPGDGRYLIQAGAFRGSAEAEALKAKIAMTGEIARVEIAQINGNTVHRVRMGPYPNASALAQAKQALAGHGIPAQAIKVK